MSGSDNAIDLRSISGIKKFLREVKIELKKVTWPTRQQLIAYTGVVFVAVTLVCILLWLFDAAFSVVFRTFLRV